MLFDYWYEMGFDDALVGCDEAQAVDTSGGNDGAVGRILQRVTNRGNFARDIQINRKNLESAAGLKIREQPAQRDFETRPGILRQYRDFHESDGAYRERYVLTVIPRKNTFLLFGKPFGPREPANNDVSIEQ